jgi:hypothetical protein
MSRLVQFTEDQWEQLRAQERALTNLTAEFGKAEDCGIACEGYRELQQELLRRISAIRSNYQMPMQ